MKNLSSLLTKGLIQAGAESAQLKTLISRCVPAESVDQVLHARIASGKLRLTVANAAWAAKFRFYSRELINQFQSEGLNISHVNIHVLPANVVPPMKRTSERVSPTAGPRTVTAIQQVANLIDQTEDDSAKINGRREPDSDLGDALRRLAKNLSAKDTSKEPTEPE